MRVYLGKGRIEIRYGALVVPPAERPRCVPLSSAAEIDPLVGRYQELVSAPSSEEDLSAVLEQLYEQLWQPVGRALPSETKRVIISPDGQLNFVSFATLLTPQNRFLAEDELIQYVASGRDLVHEVEPTSQLNFVIFANPDFEFNPNEPKLLASDESGEIGNAPSESERNDVQKLTFQRLPGTQSECDLLVREFESWDSKTRTFADKEAAKRALFGIEAPYILHLATHGFFEAQTRPNEDAESRNLRFSPDGNRSRFFDNPMHRCGLALAGAESTVESWRHGYVPAVENDGIVTAEDIGMLNLRGTWLVTLSACDTGLGEIKSGEGVVGLRRGFLEAGVQHLLMTLWKVKDTETTAHIMRDFYDTVGYSLLTTLLPTVRTTSQSEQYLSLRECLGRRPKVVTGLHRLRMCRCGNNSNGREGTKVNAGNSVVEPSSFPGI